MHSRLLPLLVLAFLLTASSAPVVSAAGGGNQPEAMPFVKYTVALHNGTVYKGNHKENSTEVSTLGESGIAFDPVTGCVYVTNLLENISVINTHTMSLVRTLNVGGEPFDIIYDQSNGNLYSSNYNQMVSVINGRTGQLNGSIPTGTYSGRMSMDNSTNSLLLLSLVTTTYERIDLSHGFSINNVSLGTSSSSLKHPVPGIAYDSGNNTVFASNFNNFSLVVLNASSGKIVHSIIIKDQVGAVYFDPAVGTVYAVATASSEVLAFNSSTYSETGNFSTGAYPTSIAVDNNGGYIFVTNELEGTLSVYGLHNLTLLENITLSSGPTGAYFVPSQGYLYVVDSGSGLLNIISTGSHSKNSDSSYLYFAIPAVAAAAFSFFMIRRLNGHAGR